MSKDIQVLINRETNKSTVNGEFTYRFPSPLQFKDSKIALASAYLFYSWQNIASMYNNNTFSYIWTDGTTNIVTLPNGMYNVIDIQSYLNSEFVKNGHYLVDNMGNNIYYISLTVNPILYKITLTCTPIPLTTLPSGYSNPNSVVLNGKTACIIIPNTPFNEIIGFNPGTYPATLTTGGIFTLNSPFIPNVPRSNVICFNCNMVNNTSFTTLPNVIHSFSPSGYAFGSQIVIDRTFPIYYNIVDGSYNEITIKLVDELSKPVNLLDPNILICLLIKQ